MRNQATFNFRSLSHTHTRPRHGPRSPPPKTNRAPVTVAPVNSKRVIPSSHASATSSRAPHSRGEEKQKLPPIKHRIEDKVSCYECAVFIPFIPLIQFRLFTDCLSIRKSITHGTGSTSSFN